MKNYFSFNSDRLNGSLLRVNGLGKFPNQELTESVHAQILPNQVSNSENHGIQESNCRGTNNLIMGEQTKE